MADERGFKGIWVPKEIWLDDRLTALEKVIFAEIDSLDNDFGCAVSNAKLAGFCGCTERKITQAISKLKGFGLIEEVSFDGRQRILKSCMHYFVEADPNKSTGQTRTKQQCRVEQNNEADQNKITSLPLNNKIYNKISYKISNKKESKEGDTFDSIICAYSDNAELQTALIEFIKMRKLKKNPVTNYGLKKLLNKLSRMTTDDAVKIAIVDQSTCKGWSGFFEIKEDELKTSRPETEDERANRELDEQYAKLVREINGG